MVLGFQKLHLKNEEYVLLISQNRVALRPQDEQRQDEEAWNSRKNKLQLSLTLKLTKNIHAPITLLEACTKKLVKVSFIRNVL